MTQSHALADSWTTPTTHPRIQPRDVSEELAATTQMVIAADEADAQQAIENARWERRGLLQRLTRLDSRRRPTAEFNWHTSATTRDRRA